MTAQALENLLAMHGHAAADETKAAEAHRDKAIATTTFGFGPGRRSALALAAKAHMDTG